MCKLFMIANAENINSEDFLKVLAKASSTITASDKDGFGWAARGSGGGIFGERYLGHKGIDFPLLVKPVMPEGYRKIFKQAEVEKWGRPEEKLAGAVLMHARSSTNKVALENSHPHRTEKFTLIHNGNVSYLGAEFKRRSSCDTEYLVHALSQGGIKKMVKDCEGWYAVGALEHRTGNFYLIKDDTTRLHGTWVKDIKSLVFATSVDHLSSICKAMAWTYHKVYEVEGNRAFIFSKSGKVIYEGKISPKSTSYKSYSGGCDYAESAKWKNWKKENLKGEKDEVVSEKKQVAALPMDGGSQDTSLNTTGSTSQTTGSDDISDAAIQELLAKEKQRQDSREYEDDLAKAMDDYYAISNGKGETIDYEEFETLMATEQLKCIFIERASGQLQNVLEFVG